MKFISRYKDIINGTWSKKWRDFQEPDLPKHLLKHDVDGINCTCGAGPFEDMMDWGKHSTGEIQ